MTLLQRRNFHPPNQSKKWRRNLHQKGIQQKCPEVTSGNTRLPVTFLFRRKTATQRSRNWIFTDFELLDYGEILSAYDDIVKYISWGEEICPKTDKKHYQGASLAYTPHASPDERQSKLAFFDAGLTRNLRDLHYLITNSLAGASYHTFVRSAYRLHFPLTRGATVIHNTLNSCDALRFRCSPLFDALRFLLSCILQTDHLREAFPLHSRSGILFLL